jgi:hypothetical protein
MYNQGMKQYALKPEFGCAGELSVISIDIRRPPKKKSARRHPKKYRSIWERHFGIKIPAGYHIHHKDKDIFNSDPSNLLCLPKDEHIKLHEMKGDANAVRLLTRGK